MESDGRQFILRCNGIHRIDELKNDEIGKRDFIIVSDDGADPAINPREIGISALKQAFCIQINHVHLHLPYEES